MGKLNMIRPASRESLPSDPRSELGNRGPVLWPQYLNIVLGLWLVVSSFVWPHTTASQVNTWVLGAIVVVFALWGLARPRVHRLNALAAVWLMFSSAWIHNVSGATAWNNIIVALLVLGFAVATDEEVPARPRGSYHHV